MADINALITTLTDAVAADNAVATYCDTTYNTTLTVYENCDSREDPPASACPLVIMSALQKSGGMGLQEKTHSIGASVVVHDEAKDTTDAGVVRYLGGRRVEALRKLVLAAITAKTPEALQLMGVDIDYDTIEQFPFISANMVLTFNETWTIGSTPFE